MRIVILGLNFSPELVGVGKYTGEMAEWLASRGHEVRMVTAPPFNPEGKVRQDYSSRRYQKEISSTTGECGNLTTFRCPLWVPRIPQRSKG